MPLLVAVETGGAPLLVVLSPLLVLWLTLGGLFGLALGVVVGGERLIIS